MNKQIKLVEGAIGKTVTAAHHSYDEAYLVFDDGTFLRLSAEQSYDSTILEPANDLLLGSCHTMHVELGIVTKAELEEYRLAELDRIDRMRADRERAEYLRLKAKFGGDA